jgi:integrase/recombinase XerC
MVQTLLLTQLAIGTRISELLALDVSDLLLEQQAVRIRWGKGRKPREVPLGERTAEALYEWLELRSEWLATRDGDGRFAGPEPTGLWLADRGRRLSPAAMSQILDEVCAHAGLKATVRNHDLRTMTARRWRREGVPIETIQQWLGHVDLAQTRRYVGDACADTSQYAEYCDLPRPGARKPSVRLPNAGKRSAATPAREELRPEPPQQPGTSLAPQGAAGELAQAVQALQALGQLQQSYPLLQQPGMVAALLQLLPGQQPATSGRPG